MLVPCVGVVLLVVSGVIMWWRRRPEGRIGAPPRVSDARLGVAAAMLVVAGVVMPLLGVSLLVVMAVDRVVVRYARAG